MQKTKSLTFFFEADKSEEGGRYYVKALGKDKRLRVNVPYLGEALHHYFFGDHVGFEWDDRNGCPFCKEEAEV